MLAAEKQILRDQAKSEGNKGKPKPANIIDKIISGRISKVSGPHMVMNVRAHYHQLLIISNSMCYLA